MFSEPKTFSKTKKYGHMTDRQAALVPRYVVSYAYPGGGSSSPLALYKELSLRELAREQINR